MDDSNRRPLIALFWAVASSRFERWVAVFGKSAPDDPPTSESSVAVAHAAWGFETQLKELDNGELQKAISMLPLHTFDAKRNAWFVPTPNDIIDMVREVPSQSLAVQQFRRGSSAFLDSEFGRRMRVALLTVPEGRPVARSAYAATLRIDDDFELQRGYQLALLWTRTPARMDRAALAQLATLPPASELLPEIATAPVVTPATAVATERHPVTEAGLRQLAEAAERLGVPIPPPIGPGSKDFGM